MNNNFLLFFTLILFLINLRKNSFAFEDTYKLPIPPICGSAHTITKRIVGGTSSRYNEFPWIAMLIYKKNGRKQYGGCSGALINQKYVLTAAHCLDNEYLGSLIAVRLGASNQYNKGTILPVSYEIIHENYDDNDDIILNDIALLELEEPLEYTSSIIPICLPFMTDLYYSPRLTTSFTVAGWGETQSHFSSQTLKKVVVPFMSRRKCKQLYFRKFQSLIPSTNICAGGVEGKDSCYGDSGGPLMRRIDNSWILEGIVSFGDTDECGTELPTVHTYIMKYKRWILNNII